MAPRPVHLEEPGFQFQSLSLATIWDSVTGRHGIHDSQFLASYFHGDFGKSGDRLLLSDHDISDDDQAWVPHHIVGEGSFGIAGLWQKSDSTGTLVDEIVIKHLLAYTKRGDPAREIQYKVKMEASIHRDVQRQARDLTDSPEHQILHIRNYKYNRTSKTCRFYSIYAPYFSLEDLIHRYKCWNEFLPELFVWHVAYSLAKAVKALSAVPHPSSLLHNHWQFEADQYSQQCFVLHMDLKPENIFLDYAPLDDDKIDEMYNDFADGKATQNSVVDTYPSVKMADFGLSWYAGPEDVGGNFTGGTEGYTPPEQTRAFGTCFQPQYQPIKAKEPWTTKHNIWGVGRILFDCITLEDWQKVDELMGLTTNSYTFPEADYHANGSHFLRINWAIPRNTPYSKYIRDLVRKCLFPRPYDRPDVETLEQETQQGLQWAREQLEAKMEAAHKKLPVPAHQDPPYRVYYRGNEIESMPLGKHSFPAAYIDYTIAKRRDMLGSKLDLPHQKWKNFVPTHIEVNPTPAEIKVQAMHSNERYQQSFEKRRKRYAAEVAARDEQRLKQQRSQQTAPPKQQAAFTGLQLSPLKYAPHPTQQQQLQPAQVPLVRQPQPVPPARKAQTVGQEQLQNAQQTYGHLPAPGLPPHHSPPPPRNSAAPAASSGFGTLIGQLGKFEPNERRDTTAPKPRQEGINNDATRRQATKWQQPKRRRGTEPEVPYVVSSDSKDEQPSRKKSKGSRQRDDASTVPAPQRSRNWRQPQAQTPDAAVPVPQRPQSPRQPQPQNQDAPVQADTPPVVKSLPTSAAYTRMTVPEMREELLVRGVVLGKGYVKKAELTRKLRDADAQGNTGRGVWKKAKT